eukprot:m51a1_g7656 hypothetical protein (416) ;mRNA; f:401370-405945
MAHEDNVRVLRGMFPTHAAAQVSEALRGAGGDLTAAVESLLREGDSPRLEAQRTREALDALTAVFGERLGHLEIASVLEQCRGDADEAAARLFVLDELSRSGSCSRAMMGCEAAEAAPARGGRRAPAAAAAAGGAGATRRAHGRTKTSAGAPLWASCPRAAPPAHSRCPSACLSTRSCRTSVATTASLGPLSPLPQPLPLPLPLPIPMAPLPPSPLVLPQLQLGEPAAPQTPPPALAAEGVGSGAGSGEDEGLDYAWVGSGGLITECAAELNCAGVWFTKADLVATRGRRQGLWEAYRSCRGPCALVPCYAAAPSLGLLGGGPSEAAGVGLLGLYRDPRPALACCDPDSPTLYFADRDARGFIVDKIDAVIAYEDDLKAQINQLQSTVKFHQEQKPPAGDSTGATVKTEVEKEDS